MHRALVFLFLFLSMAFAEDQLPSCYRFSQEKVFGLDSLTELSQFFEEKVVPKIDGGKRFLIDSFELSQADDDPSEYSLAALLNKEGELLDHYLIVQDEEEVRFIRVPETGLLSLKTKEGFPFLTLNINQLKLGPDRTVNEPAFSLSVTTLNSNSKETLQRPAGKTQVTKRVLAKREGSSWEFGPYSALPTKLRFLKDESYDKEVSSYIPIASNIADIAGTIGWELNSEKNQIKTVEDGIFQEVKNRLGQSETLSSFLIPKGLTEFEGFDESQCQEKSRSQGMDEVCEIYQELLDCGECSQKEDLLKDFKLAVFANWSAETTANQVALSESNPFKLIPKVVRQTRLNLTSLFLANVLKDYLPDSFTNQEIQIEDLNCHQPKNELERKVCEVMINYTACLNKGDHEEEFKQCDDYFYRSSPFRLGEILLKDTLKQKFSERMSSLGFLRLESKVTEIFNSCALEKYFPQYDSGSIDLEEAIKLIQLCLYETMIEAVALALKDEIGQKVQERLGNNTSSGGEIVRRSVAQFEGCLQDKGILKRGHLENILNNKRLADYSIEDFIEALEKECLFQAVDFAGEVLTLHELKQHPDLNQVFPPGTKEREDIEELAIKQGYLRCMEEQKKAGTLDPEACRGLIELTVIREGLFLELERQLEKELGDLDSSVKKELFYKIYNGVNGCFRRKENEIYTSLRAGVAPSVGQAELFPCLILGSRLAAEEIAQFKAQEEIGQNLDLVSYQEGLRNNIVPNNNLIYLFEVGPLPQEIENLLKQKLKTQDHSEVLAYLKDSDGPPLLNFAELKESLIQYARSSMGECFSQELEGVDSLGQLTQKAKEGGENCKGVLFKRFYQIFANLILPQELNLRSPEFEGKEALIKDLLSEARESFKKAQNEEELPALSEKLKVKAVEVVVRKVGELEIRKNLEEDLSKAELDQFIKESLSEERIDQLIRAYQGEGDKGFETAQSDFYRDIAIGILELKLQNIFESNLGRLPQEEEVRPIVNAFTQCFNLSKNENIPVRLLGCVNESVIVAIQKLLDISLRQEFLKYFEEDHPDLPKLLERVQTKVKECLPKSTTTLPNDFFLEQAMFCASLGLLEFTLGNSQEAPGIIDLVLESLGENYTPYRSQIKQDFEGCLESKIDLQGFLNIEATKKALEDCAIKLEEGITKAIADQVKLSLRKTWGNKPSLEKALERLINKVSQETSQASNVADKKSALNLAREVPLLLDDYLPFLERVASFAPEQTEASFAELLEKLNSGPNLSSDKIFEVLKDSSLFDLIVLSEISNRAKEELQQVFKQEERRFLKDNKDYEGEVKAAFAQMNEGLDSTTSYETFQESMKGLVAQQSFINLKEKIFQRIQSGESLDELPPEILEEASWVLTHSTAPESFTGQIFKEFVQLELTLTKKKQYILGGKLFGAILFEVTSSDFKWENIQNRPDALEASKVFASKIVKPIIAQSTETKQENWKEAPMKEIKELVTKAVKTDEGPVWWEMPAVWGGKLWKKITN